MTSASLGMLVIAERSCPALVEGTQPTYPKTISLMTPLNTLVSSEQEAALTSKSNYSILTLTFIGPNHFRKYSLKLAVYVDSELRLSS
jgi:hypothetical protein